MAAGLKSYAHSIPALHTPSMLSGGESRPASPPPGFLGPHFIADAAAKAAPAVVNITVSQGRLPPNVWVGQLARVWLAYETKHPAALSFCTAPNMMLAVCSAPQMPTALETGLIWGMACAKF